MNFIKKHSFFLIGLISILLIFRISVSVRSANLNSEVGRYHEWITAHTLLTCQIWDENGGPSAYNFNPVYTYPGDGNEHRDVLGGVTAKNGDVYYVSYPPFTFLFNYYVSELLGGQSVANIRNVSLLVHFVTALLIFVLVGMVRPLTAQNTFNFPGLIAATIYIFVEGNLWFHGNLFFVDMMVQPLFIGGMILTIKYLKNDFKRKWLILGSLFFVFFLASYTEWLGLLSAFFTGLFFLIKAIISKNKTHLLPFFSIGLGASLALGLTMYQYSTINGWEQLKAVSQSKYDERSGHTASIDSAKENNLSNPESFETLTEHLDDSHYSIADCLVLCLTMCIFVAVAYRFTKEPNHEITQKNYLPGILLGLLFTPIIAHYLLFYNFNVLHSFGSLKIVAVTVVLTAIVFDYVYRRAKKMNQYLGLTLLLFFGILIGLKMNDEAANYTLEYPLEKLDMDRIESAKIIKKYSSPATAVMTNIPLTPEQMYYAHHSISPISGHDTTVIHDVLRMRQNKTGDYYHHNGSKLITLTRYELRDNKLSILDTFVFAK
jgi:hypothetical protein